MDTPEDRNTQEIIEMLDSLKDVPQRSSRMTAQGKAQFLREARLLKKAVSRSLVHRLNNWIMTLPIIRFRKERSPMITIISSLVLALAILLGSGSITAYAALDSLPDETLYPVKLFLEEARYNLTDDPNTQVELLTKYANNRIDEVAALASQGDNIPEAVMINLQTNLQLMLHLAAGMDDETTAQALQQIRENLRTQEHLMTMLGQPDDVDPLLEQLRSMLQEQHRLTQFGLDEPLKFQQMFGYNKDETPNSSIEPSEPQGDQNGDCLEPGDCIPKGDGQDASSSSGNYGDGSQNNSNPGGTGNAGTNGDQGQGQPPDGAQEGGGNDSGSGNENGDDPGSGGNDDSGGDDGPGKNGQNESGQGGGKP